MKLSLFKYIFFVGVFCIALYSCVKKTLYPVTPVIEYYSFTPYTDNSADIQVKYTDGDGDIGVANSDSTKTLWIKYYYKDTITQKYTGYYRPLSNDTLITGYIVNEPTDSYKGKPISGDISVHLQQFRHSIKIKHVKYVIYLIDKAGNRSNVISTPEFTID
jgi:hypothetical protein